MRKFYNMWDYDTESALSRSIPDCDINVATYYLTAYPALRSGKGVPFYYVQHYEPLFFEDKYNKAVANSTYFLPLKKLVVSEWLGNLMKSMTHHAALFVGNGVDTKLARALNRVSLEELIKISKRTILQIIFFTRLLSAVRLL